MTDESKADVSQMPRFDISNEAWRTYIYGDGVKLHIETPLVLILEKRASGDVHRLIVQYEDGTAGMYIKPGWVGIIWQDRDKSDGIVF